MGTKAASLPFPTCGVAKPHLINPAWTITCSSPRSSLSISARFSLISRVSRPWMVFAAAQRFRPCSALRLVEAPPCVWQTALPRIAGLRHCTPLRLERDWLRGTFVVPNAVVMSGSFAWVGTGCLNGILRRISWSLVLRLYPKTGHV
jgi:hypothetical protein